MGCRSTPPTAYLCCPQNPPGGRAQKVWASGGPRRCQCSPGQNVVNGPCVQCRHNSGSRVGRRAGNPCSTDPGRGGRLGWTSDPAFWEVTYPLACRRTGPKPNASPTFPSDINYLFANELNCFLPAPFSPRLPPPPPSPRPRPRPLIAPWRETLQPLPTRKRARGRGVLGDKYISVTIISVTLNRRRSVKSSVNFVLLFYS